MLRVRVSSSAQSVLRQVSLHGVQVPVYLCTMVSLWHHSVGIPQWGTEHYGDYMKPQCYITPGYVALHSPIAQLAEHSTVNRKVTGSNPVGGATFHCTKLLCTNSGVFFLFIGTPLSTLSHHADVVDVCMVYSME